jgi:hypothetical protein
MQRGICPFGLATACCCAELAGPRPPHRLAGQSWVGLLGVVLSSLLMTPALATDQWVTTARMDEILQRLERAEGSLADLQEQNRQLQERLEGTLATSMVAPQSAPASPAPAAAAPEPEPKKDKKWYDKISLRGYAQFRYNYPLHRTAGSATPQHAGDSSIGPDQEFLIRRARLILYGDVSDHLYVYFQPDFASTPNAAVDGIEFAQIRDWYGDVYADKDKVHRFRIGQSKVPYGWENLQSSSNRLYLDRNDAFNSSTRNERDLGVFYYWTPQWAQEVFEFISDENLKGSGNYGVFGIGPYNGQGGSLREFNDQLHVAARVTLPLQLASEQVVEFGVQGYTGQYVVLGSAIAPLGVGPAVVPLGTRNRPGGEDGLLDQRLGWSLVYYPQPLGFQIEHTIGRGPELDAAQTAVERGSVHGGYAMINYRYKSACHGEFWPYARWQYFEGGYRSFPNAPSTSIDEWNIGLEWQIRKEMELTCEYLITDRTNLLPQTTGLSYEQFAGQVLRFQFQVNY